MGREEIESRRCTFESGLIVFFFCSNLAEVITNVGEFTKSYKATEVHTGAIVIQKITRHNIKALQKRAAHLIEFISNSITCGAAADASEITSGTGKYHDHHNAYYAYGPGVARALGSNFILSSVSGISVLRQLEK